MDLDDRLDALYHRHYPESERRYHSHYFKSGWFDYVLGTRSGSSDIEYHIGWNEAAAILDQHELAFARRAD